MTGRATPIWTSGKCTTSGWFTGKKRENLASRFVYQRVSLNHCWFGCWFVLLIVICCLLLLSVSHANNDPFNDAIDPVQPLDLGLVHDQLSPHNPLPRCPNNPSAEFLGMRSSPPEFAKSLPKSLSSLNFPTKSMAN